MRILMVQTFYYYRGGDSTYMLSLTKLLEEKGHLRHKKAGRRYVFYPSLPRLRASRSALKGLVQTFFEGSAERAIVALLDLSASKLSDDEFERLATLIEDARRKGK